MPRAPKDPMTADLSARLERCAEERARAEQQRDSAEERGRRWLEELLSLNDEIERLMKHIEAEVRAGNARAVHHHLYRRLTIARDAARSDS
jgi:hypothetical protein